MSKVTLYSRKIQPKLVRKIKRKRKVRAKITGTAARPRLTIYRSNRNIFAQAINDEEGCTICTVSSIEKGMERKNVTLESVKNFAELFVQRLQEKAIKELIFDRNGYRFHGIIKAFVDFLRDKGIKI